MRQWLYDGLLRKLFKNSAILFSGNIVSSIIGLVSLAITARALGVEQFGYLVLISTYVLIVDKLVNFQSWQAIIKYGADALEHNKKNDFKSLLKFGFILDIGTAVLGTLLAASAAWFIGSWIGWKDEHKLMAAAYSFTILFHISGTPIAILRLFDQFKKTSIQQVYASVFKLVGVTIAFILDAGLWGFLLVWALTDILGKILLVYYARKELITRKIPNSIKLKTCPVQVTTKLSIFRDALPPQ
jgi:O-antigen/teichoic acid export membrane protein